MIDAFQQQKLLKSSQVKKILDQAYDFYSKFPNVIDVTIGENGRLTVCVCLTLIFYFMILFYSDIFI